jgi:predicted nucleotidyltransferase
VSVELLEKAAKALGPALLHDVVFLGGASIQLWLSDPGAPPSRATDDVDVISAITTRVDYYRFGERLRARGFSEASDSPIICRWRHRQTALLLDVMPLTENVLGFSNPWYRHAIDNASERPLPSGEHIKAAIPPSIIATKLAAWHGRGKDDMLASLDLHDILVLIDGRPELSAEIGAESTGLRSYIAQELAALRSDPYFPYLLESALHGYGQLAAPRAEHLRRQIDAVIAAG